MRIVIAIILLHTAVIALAISQDEIADEGWRWVHFTTTAGLPSDRIIQIFETPGGTPWVATASGLAWFDGFQWHRVGSDTLVLQYPGIRICDVVGESLLVSLRGQLGFLDRAGVYSTLGDSTTAALSVGKDSVVYLRNASLYLVDHGHSHPFPTPRDATQRTALSISKSASGSLWTSFPNGLFEWEGKEWHCRLPAEASPITKTILVENAKKMGLVAIHFPYAQRGLWEWSGRSALRRIEEEKPDNVKTLDIAPNGDNAIVVFQSDDVRIRHGGHWGAANFRQQGVRDIMMVRYRQNGDLWIGTDHGLFLLRQSSSRWTYWTHEPPDLRNTVNEILRTRDGSFWIATGDGLEVRRPDGSVQTITHIGGVPLYVVTGIVEDSEGHVWISSGSSFTGTFRWDGNRWDHFSITSDSGGFLIHKIRIDRLGRLWFLGIGRNYPIVDEQQPGAYVLEHGKFTRWGRPEGLLSGRVYSFAQDSHGALWFGTFLGLSRWKNGSWKHWTLRDGLRSSRAFTLTVDREDRVWFGDISEPGALGCIDTVNTLTYFTVADGLVSNIIWDIRSDSYGELWVATQAGLASYNGNVWRAYDARSGLQHLPCWPVLPLEDAVYVGTSGRGVAILHREKTRTPDPVVSVATPIVEGQDALIRWQSLSFWGELAPPEILTRFRLDEEPWSAWAHRFEEHLRNLPAGTHVLRVQARGIAGTFDAEGAAASFDILPPLYARPAVLFPVGSLAALVCTMIVLLVLRKRRHDLALRKSEEKFRTVIETTASAICMHSGTTILFANAATEALTGFTRDELQGMDFASLFHHEERESVRERELKRTGQTTTSDRFECRIVTKQGEERWVDITSGWIRYEGIPVRLATALDITERKEAEMKMRLLASELSMTEERERHRMASYLHDVIGQGLALAKIKIRRLQKTSAQSADSEPLEEIRQMIEQSIYSTQSLTFELCPPILYELSLEAAVEWLTEKLHQQYGITFSFRNDKQTKPVAIDIRVVLFQAVRELCINAVKHSEAKHIDVSITRMDGTIRISVSDNGIGFDPTMKTSGRAGGGFGLFNVRERLKNFSGSMSITSSPTKGTSVVIEAPLSQQTALSQ